MRGRTNSLRGHAGASGRRKGYQGHSQLTGTPVVPTHTPAGEEGRGKGCSGGGIPNTCPGTKQRPTAPTKEGCVCVGEAGEAEARQPNTRSARMGSPR